MSVFTLRHRSVAQKLVLLVCLAVTPLILGFAFYLLPHFSDILLQDRRGYVENMVRLAHETVAHYHAQAESGSITDEEAQARAIAHIKALRYQGNNYFWINDMHPRMIMHPTKPALDGNDLSDFRDKRDKALFVEFVKVCEARGEGFVGYYWPRPESEEPVEKLSYVQLFAPWGWIVGSGIYIDDVAAETRAMQGRLVALLAVAILIVGAVTRWIGRRITVPLNLTVAAMREVARGNLTQKIDLEQRDELGALAQAANEMTVSLRTLVGQTSATGINLGAAADQLSAAIAQVASSNQQLNAQSQTMATASEEISASVTQVAQNTESVNASSAAAKRVAAEGGQVIAEAVGAMNQVATVVQRAAGTVANLGEQSEAIGAVVDMIEDVADQTNLLALNAAIEAARAGEHGRGFAVVADEVRNLAEKTMKATQEISSTITKIQSESRSAVEAMEQGRAAVDTGMQLGERAGTAVEAIEARIGDASGETEQIAAAIDQLATTVQELATNMEQIAAGVEESSVASAEIAQTAETVASQAQELVESTHQFQL